MPPTGFLNSLHAKVYQKKPIGPYSYFNIAGIPMQAKFGVKSVWGRVKDLWSRWLENWGLAPFSCAAVMPGSRIELQNGCLSPVFLIRKLNHAEIGDRQPISLTSKPRPR